MALGTIEAVRGYSGDFALKSFAFLPPTVALKVIPIIYKQISLLYSFILLTLVFVMEHKSKPQESVE